MVEGLEIRVLDKGNHSAYIRVGRQSYREHYLHLWENNNPTPYLKDSFTEEVVLRELESPEIRSFIAYYYGEAVGILKLVLDADLPQFTLKPSTLLEKIYLLRSATGKGIGRACVHFIIDYCRKKGKKVLWLETMKKGRTKAFYSELGFDTTGEKKLGFKGVKKEEAGMFILSYLL